MNFDVGALPPGSVVDAEVTSKWTGKRARRLFFRRVYPDDPAPWIAQQDVGDQAWWHHDDLRDVRVVYEPARAASQETAPSEVVPDAH